MKPLHKKIHDQAVLRSKNYNKAAYELLKIIETVEKYQVYYAFKCKSLSDYCVSQLGLTYDVAMMFIGVMRKSRKFNALDSALKENKISMTSARKIAPILTAENQSFWIAEAEKTSENLQQKIATAFPERMKKETVKTVSEEYVSITIRVKKTDFEKIKNAKDLQSGKSKRVLNFEESIVKSSEFYLEKNDPIVKAERILSKKQSTEMKEENPETLVLKPENTAAQIPAKNRHIVHRRDKGQCQEIDKNGKKCGSRDFTEIHHIIPRSQGGSHDPKNLITLCSGHHKATHFLMGTSEKVFL